MPRLIDIPQREDDENVWRDLECAVGRTSLWRFPPQQLSRGSRRGLTVLLSHGGAAAWHVSRAARSWPVDPFVEDFEELADRWERETALESVVVRKAMHPAYQRIIGLGPKVVPLILSRLARKPGQWFWALTAITGEDPAAGETSVEGAAEAWLQWGNDHGLAVG